MSEQRTDEGWSFEPDLRPFPMALGRPAGYRLDEDDRAPIRPGVEGTDASAGLWYHDAPGGDSRVAFSPALDQAGTGVVLVRTDPPAEYGPRVGLLADFCRHFRREGRGDARTGADRRCGDVAATDL